MLPKSSMAGSAGAPLVALEAQSRSGAVQAWTSDGSCVYHAPALIGVRAAARLPQALVAAVAAHQDQGLTAPPRLAVLAGPGAFTGLRIAAFCARALAWSDDLPVVAVDHLAALAAATGVADAPIFIAVALKNDTTFVGVYHYREDAWQALAPTQAVLDTAPLPAPLAAAAAQTRYAAGPAWASKRDILSRRWGRNDGVVLSTDAVTPRGIALAAATQPGAPWHKILPHYGQASAAELQLAARQVSAQQSTAQQSTAQQLTAQQLTAQQSTGDREGAA